MLLIATNWFFFIYTTQTGQLTKASLGYLILPRVAIFLGFCISNEKLSPGHWFAVALAALDVIALTYGLGVTPWIALTLATSFSFYAVLKKDC
ncbi:MAG: hypothetical protein CML56_03500 [Rhodobacteraceae bacterium]|nr:hypothetical protein [Paracoccaceae bacterium]